LGKMKTETDIIGRSLQAKYVCPKCGFKLTVKERNSSSNIEITDKISNKARKRRCIACSDGVFKLLSIICKTESVSNKDRGYYVLGWVCNKCNIMWYSVERDIEPGLDFSDQIAKIKFRMSCISEPCKSNDFRMITVQYNKKM